MRMEGRVESKGGKIFAKLGQIQNVVFPVIASKLEDGALAIHADAVRAVQAHVSVSHQAMRYNPKRQVEVSAPGNPPNSDTGHLAQNIEFEIDSENLTAVVGTNVLYGTFLELGTAKMDARPWLYPAFDRHRQEILSAVREAVKSAIQGVRE